MASYHDKERPPRSTSVSEATQSELDLRLFHLKTLYDVSRELLGIVDINLILKNFLLMTLGNFGVAEGFIFARDSNAKKPLQLIWFGFSDDVEQMLQTESNRMLDSQPSKNIFLADDMLQNYSFLTQPLACLLTFAVDDEFRGIVGLGTKIVDESFSREDQNLLETLINNLVVSLKNAKSSEALKEAYEEMTLLNRAKDKLINHLSHELQTPLAVLLGALKLLKKKLASVPQENWQRAMERAEKNLRRLLEMQMEVQDIIKRPQSTIHHNMCRLLDECADELEVLIAENLGHPQLLDKIRSRIDEIFYPGDNLPENIYLDQFVKAQFEKIRPCFSHRNLDLIIDTESTPYICIPSEPLEKLIVGLAKNAVENTPDEGKIEVNVRNNQQSVEFAVNDAGVGIVKEHRQRIFEGFFPTQETSEYSSKMPFDFNAGGRGADLLRLKIFSERFNFKLDMKSDRCRHIPLHSDICPGRISECSFCHRPEDCYTSGGTSFNVIFPTADR